MSATINASGNGGSAAPTEELRAALERIFGIPVDSLVRRRHEYQTSFALEELDVRLADGRSHHLLFKNLGGPSEKALRAKPAFVVDPRREITVYRELLEGSEIGTPRCYGAVADPVSDRYWLFIEHVPGPVLWQVAELAVWEAVARWLAALHTRFEDARSDHLLFYDRALYETWFARALAGSAGRELTGLAPAYATVVDRLLEQPTTFVHGECYPSNVLVPNGPSGTRVCPIDWEMAGLGPGLLDVAALTAGDWSDGERDAMVTAYYDALPSPPPRVDFLEALESCRLQIAVQWLGWADGWSPPSEHAKDWLGEALRAADRLELT
jgi:hypothetical protein